MLTRAVSESGVNMPELMDQQCGLVWFLQHQTECPYKYFREYEGMFRIVSYHCWNISGLVISFGVYIPVKVAFVHLQSYFISSDLKLALRLEIWYSLWKWSVITDNSGCEFKSRCNHLIVIDIKISKRGPCLWLAWMGHFTTILHHQQLHRHAFF